MVQCGTCNDADIENEAEYEVTIVDDEGKPVVTAFLCWSCKTAFEWGQARPDSEVSPSGEGREDESEG